MVWSVEAYENCDEQRSGNNVMGWRIYCGEGEMKSLKTMIQKKVLPCAN